MRLDAEMRRMVVTSYCETLRILRNMNFKLPLYDTVHRNFWRDTSIVFHLEINTTLVENYYDQIRTHSLRMGWRNLVRVSLIFAIIVNFMLLFRRISDSRFAWIHDFEE
jgi:hypothetical protein